MRRNNYSLKISYFLENYVLDSVHTLTCCSYQRAESVVSKKFNNPDQKMYPKNPFMLLYNAPKM